MLFKNSKKNTRRIPGLQTKKWGSNIQENNFLKNYKDNLFLNLPKYCMSKKSGPSLFNNLQYKMGPDFLGHIVQHTI